MALYLQAPPAKNFVKLNFTSLDHKFILIKWSNSTEKFFFSGCRKEYQILAHSWYSINLLTIIRCKNLFQFLSLKLQFKKFYDEMINTVNIHKEIQLNVLLISVSFFKNLYYLSFLTIWLLLPYYIILINVFTGTYFNSQFRKKLRCNWYIAYYYLLVHFAHFYILHSYLLLIWVGIVILYSGSPIWIAYI